MSSNEEITQLIFRKLNTAFESQPLEVKEDNVETVIKLLVTQRSVSVTNIYAISANFLKLMMEQKDINPNFILSALVKHTRNYIGLFLIGLAIRKGANPNVYIPQQGYGNLHIACLAAIRPTAGINDPYFRYIINLLRIMGSNIDYQAYNVREHDHEEIDVKYLEKISKEAQSEGSRENFTLTVSQFIQEQGKIANENLQEFLDTISDNYLVHFIIATDNKEMFFLFSKGSFMADILISETKTQVMLFNISVAGAMNIANEITKKTVPSSVKLMNAQTLPIYVAILSFDKDLFSLMVKKSSSVKYPSINQLIAMYKKYKDDRLFIYKNAYHMILDAVNVGVEIDLYQYDLFSSSADFDELEAVKKAYEQPRWKKLCSIATDSDDGPVRQELKQIAFELNLDVGMTEEQMCNKFKQISLINREDYFKAAVERQQDRMEAELSTNVDYLGTFLGKGSQKPRCNPKTMVLKNPYAFCDARMAFYRDPKDSEVWCFTSDTFTQLINTKINPYNGERLPDKFVETLRAQVTILREMGLFDFDHSIQDTMKEYFDRGNKPNNKKTDFAYNTATRCIGLFGVSESRLASLKTITLEDTILRDICGVRLNYFNILTPKHQLITAMRIVYSISKQKNFESSEFYELIARSINGEFAAPIGDVAEQSQLREFL